MGKTAPDHDQEASPALRGRMWSPMPLPTPLDRHGQFFADWRGLDQALQHACPCDGATRDRHDHVVRAG